MLIIDQKKKIMFCLEKNVLEVLKINLTEFNILFYNVTTSVHLKCGQIHFGAGICNILL